MPNVYREKECPQCGIKHRKKGPYCSKACHNKHRVVTDATREKMSRSRYEYNQTPEGTATRAKTARLNVERSQTDNFNPISVEEFAVDIPDIRELTDYDFLSDYDKAEEW